MGMLRTFALLGSAAAAAALASAAGAQTVVKVGVITSYTGFLAAAGDEMDKGVALYVKEHEKELPAGVTIEVITAGAPLRWVTPSSPISRQTTSGRTARRQTCVPPTAVTPHVVHQPLQWNIGSVQRYTDEDEWSEWMTSPRELR